MLCLFKPDMHHSCLCIMPCLCGGCLPWLFASFWCCFFGLVPITSRLWGSVRLRPFVFFVDSFLFLAGFQARWPYPRNHFNLCLLDARSFAMPMLRYLPLAYHASILLNQASNPPCPSKPLFGYVTALLSPSYSVVSCRWILELVPCLEHGYFVGISQYLFFCRVQYLLFN